MSSKKVEVMTITPEIAKEWLEKNYDGNRKIKEDVVKSYARQMSNGMWTDSNDAICFSKDGVLLNGQHRLNACVHSGCEFTSIVRWDADPDSFANMDIGARRTNTDIARGIRGADKIATSSTMRATMKALYGLCYGINIAHARLSAVEEIEIIDRWRGIAELAYHWYTMTCVNGRTVHRNTYTLGACVCAVANGVPIATVEKFISALCNNVDMSLSGFNVRAALMYKDAQLHSAKSGMNLNESHPNFVAAKEAIYLFANNYRRTSIKGLYPMSPEKLDALNEAITKGW